MSEIRVNSIKNEAGSGAVELTHGATIPSGASLSGAGGLNVTGVVTATSFSGPLTGDVTGTASNATTLVDGANITTGTISDDRLPDLISSNVHVISGVSTFATASANSFVGTLTGNVTGTALTATNANGLQGTPDITVNNVTAGIVTATTLEITGNANIGGVLTYEDVTSVDSIGFVTARQGIDVSAGGINVEGGARVNGITTTLGDVRIQNGGGIDVAGIATVGFGVRVVSGGIDVGSGIVTAAGFAGDLTGNVTGNVVGNVTGNLTGSATTLSDAANITTGTIAAGRLTGSYNIDISGNASSASNATEAEGLTPGIDIEIVNLTSTNINNSGIATLSNLRGIEYVQAPHGTTVNHSVTVAAKTAAHRYNGTGSSNGYVIDGVESPFLTLTPGRTYRFNLSSGDMTTHPFRFYHEAARTNQYTTNVSTASTYTEIVVTDSTPTVLHYQCSAHAYMGNAIQTNSNVVNSTYDATLRGGLNVVGVLTAPAGIDGVAIGLTDGSYNLNTSGIITATGGFIGAASTTPVVITHSAGVLTFTVAGIGSTSLALA